MFTLARCVVLLGGWILAAWVLMITWGAWVYSSHTHISTLSFNVSWKIMLVFYFVSSVLRIMEETGKALDVADKADKRKKLLKNR